MTGLDSVKENEESTAAFLYLIALAIKKYTCISILVAIVEISYYAKEFQRMCSRPSMKSCLNS